MGDTVRMEDQAHPLEFVVARNTEPDSTLPFLVRLPLPDKAVVLKTKDTWPRTAKVYCHRAEWPEQVDIVERVPIRRCVQRGAAIDLVLDRGRENRSQFVLTHARGREMIFWQSPRTTKQARPAVTLPTRRALGQVLEIVVDTQERYAYGFAHQQATTRRQRLPAGDYAVELNGAVVAAVERKSLADLVASLTSGKLTYALAELAGLPRAAVVVEDRYSSVFKIEYSSPGVVADGLAELQARFPSVPLIFAETRQLAQEWTYRFLGAALQEVAADHDDPLAAHLASAGAVAPAPPTAADIRAWAQANGIDVSRAGRIPHALRERYLAAHGS